MVSLLTRANALNISPDLMEYHHHHHQPTNQLYISGVVRGTETDSPDVIISLVTHRLNGKNAS